MARLTISRLLLAAALLLATACGEREEGALAVAWIAHGDERLLMDGVRLSPGAQHVRAATQAGLVTLDDRAEVIPALAERWIITEDGLSFIFRLREGTWPDGTELTSQSVQQALQRTIRALRDTSLGLDLAQVEEIRAMTGRVVELRLAAPVPDLLRLLAQPELTLMAAEGGTGQMELEYEAGETDDDGEGAPAVAPESPMVLRYRPPEARGLPEQPEWEAQVRELALTTATAEEAIARFDAGTVGVVLGGRIDHLPLVDTGPLSRGTVRIDATIGLFGLLVRQDAGLLADDGVREALAMAIDRAALMAPYNVGGWVPTTRIVSPILPGDPGYVPERWTTMTIEERRAEAARRVAAWVAGQDDGAAADADAADIAGSPARLTLTLEAAPGLDMLFADLAAQWALIGVELVRSDDPPAADLALFDRVARYADPLWFLNQFDCSLDRGPCNEDADYLLELAREAIDPVERATLLAETEAELTGSNFYIPIGVPLRWSLVRSGVVGYAPNVYAFHPLPPMARLPN